MPSHARPTATFCQMRESIRQCGAGRELTDAERAALDAGRLWGVVGTWRT